MKKQKIALIFLVATVGLASASAMADPCQAELTPLENCKQLVAKNSQPNVGCEVEQTRYEQCVAKSKDSHPSSTTEEKTVVGRFR